MWPPKVVTRCDQTLWPAKSENGTQKSYIKNIFYQFFPLISSTTIKISQLFYFVTWSKNPKISGHMAVTRPESDLRRNRKLAIYIYPQEVTQQKLWPGVTNFI